jgi:hypothetical protein
MKSKDSRYFRSAADSPIIRMHSGLSGCRHSINPQHQEGESS